MTIQFHFPENLPPSVLDEYLSRGWFRMRQSVFTCRYVMGSGVLHTAVWIRVNIENYQFSKSLRKLLAKNDRLFRYEILPMVINDTHHELYERYRENFHSDISETIDDALFDEDKDIFDSMLINIYDHERLVAYSIFDKGSSALESIKGVWDPDYSSYSLGLYSMLLEVQYGQENNFKYYYPGYIAPGCPSFDYKTRMYPYEYWDPTSQNWFSGEKLKISHLPSEKIKVALGRIQEALREEGIEAPIHLYPPYRHIWDKRFNDCLREPLFLLLPSPISRRKCLVIVWDTNLDVYVLYECTIINNLEEFMTGVIELPKAPSPYYYLLRINRQSARTQFTTGLINSLKKLNLY